MANTTTKEIEQLIKEYFERKERKSLIKKFTARYEASERKKEQ